MLANWANTTSDSQKPIKNEGCGKAWDTRGGTCGAGQLPPLAGGFLPLGASSQLSNKLYGNQTNNLSRPSELRRA